MKNCCQTLNRSVVWKRLEIAVSQHLKCCQLTWSPAEGLVPEWKALRLYPAAAASPRCSPRRPLWYKSHRSCVSLPPERHGWTEAAGLENTTRKKKGWFIWSSHWKQTSELVQYYLRPFANWKSQISQILVEPTLLITSYKILNIFTASLTKKMYK